MEKLWSLKELYSSIEGEDFKHDFNEIKTIMTELGTYVNKEKNDQVLHNYLVKTNELNDLIEKVYCFVNLQMNVDTTNQEIIKLYNQIGDLLASFAEDSAKLSRWVGEFDLDQIQDPYCLEHLYILKEMKDVNKYLLSDQSEALLAKMKMTGSSAWQQYKDQLISGLTVTIDEKEYPLTEVLNMAYSKDADERKKAYYAEVDAYKSIENGVASALNAIKGEALTVTEMRGYDSVLQRTLIDSRMTQKTLDVLIKTMQKACPLFQDFYKLKAKKLGYSNGLPWYDMYANLSNAKSDYTYEEAALFIEKQFSSFSETLGQYARNAVEKNWVDVEPRAGKVGGAFCSNLHSIKESRFLLNFGGDISDVITMAHELGHGFHGHCLNEEYSLNAQYPMPIAETASTFCETIVKKAAIKEGTNEEKCLILENELSDSSQVIVDIYSRFLFESRFFEKRKDGPLSVEEIKELMVEAQKEAYGDGLDHNVLHPYMWTWKPHYYEADYAFYNFPYAFGLLLAKGLYGMYLKEGASFAKKYEQFLSLTGKNDLVDVAKSVGIDLEDESFWQNSIDMIKQDLNEYYQLVETMS